MRLVKILLVVVAVLLVVGLVVFGGSHLELGSTHHSVQAVLW